MRIVKPHPSQEKLRRYFHLRDDGALVWKFKRGRSAAGREAGCINNHGRWKVSVDGEYFLRSRLVWIYVNGDIPDGLEIDHIDRDGLNDRIENLRLATRSENQCNQGPKGKKKYRGVSRAHSASGWVAHIWIDGRCKHLGTFSTPESAALTYNEAAKRFYGEFAYQNEVPLCA